MESVNSSGGRCYAAGKNLLLLLIVPGLFFGGLELILAIAGIRPYLATEDPLLGFSRHIPLFVEDRLADGSVILKTADNKLSLFNYQQFLKDKNDHTYRIFCMGGSTTYGRPYDNRTSFCGWLRTFLRVVDPARSWEVINAGGISYASYRVATLMEELARYQPDMFIVYSGHNEFLEQRSYGRLADLPAWILRLNSTLANTRVYTVVEKTVEILQTDSHLQAGKHSKMSGEVDDILAHTIGPTSYHRNETLRRQILAHYRLNLERMIDIARGANAKIMFITPAVNLKDMSPFKSEHRDDLGDEALNRWNSLYQQATTQYRTGAFDEALDSYRQALKIDDRYAELHYRMGQVLFKLERFDEAEQAFRRAVDEDIAPLRMLGSMRKTIEETASHNDAPLVDFPQILRKVYRQQYGQPILGQEYFLDHVHPTIDGNRLLALALLDRLVALGIVTPPKSTSVVIDAATAEVMAGLDDQAHGRALLNLGRVLDWAGKFDEARRPMLQALELLGPDADAYLLLSKNMARTGRQKEAGDYLRKALALDPDMAEAHRSLGELLMKQGRLDDAIDHYRKSLQTEPGSYTAHTRLGILFAQQGKGDAALQHFNEAIRLQPDDIDARFNLALFLTEHKRYDEAASYFKEILRDHPDHYQTRDSLGIVFAKQGRLDDAIDQFAAALRIKPDYVKAQQNLQKARELRHRNAAQH